MLMMNSRGNAGFTLIEVLVSMIIFLVSALGIAGLVVRNVQHETESYQRVQALVLLQDMVDRMNANREVAACYSSSAAGLDVGTSPDTIPACTLGSATQKSQAVTDLQEWSLLLQGAAEKNSDDSDAGSMEGARGCIRQIDAANRIYRISVSWQGVGPTVIPSEDCGENSYGDERYRRTVSAVVRMGKLS